MGYGAGLWPPGKRNVWAGLRAVRHMARAHAAAYRVIKVRQPEALVGPSIRARRFEPDDPYSAADLRVALREERRSIDIFLEAVTTGRWPGPLPGTDTAACADVAGVAFFGQERVRRNVMRALRLGVERVDAEGNRLERPRPEPNPQAFREVIQRVARRGLPVVVTGNGRAATDDAGRQGFLARRAAETGRLRAEGVDLRGYMHYALLDGFEWDLGWSARYGLVHVDRETGARTPNPSAYLYRDIAAYDGLPPAAAQRYGVEEGLDADHRD
jgi:beta-glucosidase/6-phospho-beta-glucosidase/beta-galactosidase